MSYDIVLQAANNTKINPVFNCLITETDFKNALIESNQTEPELLNFLQKNFNFILIQKQSFLTQNGLKNFYNFRCSDYDKK